MEWLNEVLGFNVEKKEIKRPGNKPYFQNSNTRIGVLHTTEGTTVDGAWETLSASRSAPHFITGENRIVQCRPLTAQAAALRANLPKNPNIAAQVQIEMVARSKQSLWLPSNGTLAPTVALMAYCAQQLGIPLRVPADWPDDCSDVELPWASNNSRRKKAAEGLWPVEKGWWMHMEVPWQDPTWHWDCGAIKRTVLITMAKQVLER